MATVCLFVEGFLFYGHCLFMAYLLAALIKTPKTHSPFPFPFPLPFPFDNAFVLLQPELFGAKKLNSFRVKG